MKISALGVLLLAGSTILAACDGNRNYPPPSSATPVASSSGKVPTQADIDACNEYAHNQTKTGTGEVVKDAAIGGVGGAAVGAGGGAIAGGGSGGGLVGVAAGTLYGLNENKRGTAGYESAYSTCMSQRGY